MCVCFHCKDAKKWNLCELQNVLENILWVTFIRLWSSSFKDKGQLSPPFIKHPMCVCFHCLVSKNVQVVKFVIWRMFLRTFLLFLSFLRQLHVNKKNSCVSLSKTAHVLVFLLLDVQKCSSCKICHMENVLKNIPVVPFLFETTTRD